MATMNVTVRNVITSMRLITWFDWAEFVESVGLVDEVLRSRSAFAEMDFTTRNRYRNAVEELARRSPRTEVEVATSRGGHGGPGGAPADDATTPRRVSESRDPGYYLISAAAPISNAPSAARVPRLQRIERAMLRAGGALYVGLLAARHRVRHRPLAAALGDRGWALVVVGILAIGPASTLAVTIVNHDGHTIARSATLPRLELDDGVPTEMRTLVAVPMLLTSAADVDAQVAALEVHYLGNREGDLRFALLSDWIDADERACRRR